MFKKTAIALSLALALPLASLPAFADESGAGHSETSGSESSSGMEASSNDTGSTTTSGTETGSNDTGSTTTSGTETGSNDTGSTTTSGTETGGNDNGSSSGNWPSTEVEHQELDQQLQASGYQVAHYPDGHLEVQSQNGERYAYAGQTTSQSGGSCTQALCLNPTNSGVEVQYASGNTETYSPGVHDLGELAAYAQQQGFSVLSQQNGVVTVRYEATGAEYHLGISPQLASSGQGQTPGIHVDNGKVTVQYQDGLSQDLSLN